MKIYNFNEFITESNTDDKFELKYEKWKLGGYSKGSFSWNLYKNGKIICAISNYNNDKNNVLVKHIESAEKGMATKLVFMLLDNGVVIETGKPDYNSISTSAYYMNKKIVGLIDENKKYKYTILGKADNSGKEDYEPYIDVIGKEDNFHYRFEKTIDTNNIKNNLNENVNSYPKLLDLAKLYDYETFLKKSDSVTSIYNILYRGMYDQELTDNSFFTDYIGHATQYGDYVDGIIYNDDILYFDDNTFNNLRRSFETITKKELNNIYILYFRNHKLYDAMVGEYSDEASVIKFVANFLKSNIPYTKVQQNKVKNDLLIPIMLHYAQMKGKNIIQFVGGDYIDYGGADEFVVNDITKYTKLSDIWKSVN